MALLYLRCWCNFFLHIHNCNENVIHNSMPRGLQFAISPKCAWELFASRSCKSLVTVPAVKLHSRVCEYVTQLGELVGSKYQFGNSENRLIAINVDSSTSCWTMVSVL
jgi:hypothetical protein